MSKKSTIVYACNDAYAYHTLISIYSILKYNANRGISFIILENDVSEQRKKDLEHFISKFPLASISFLAIDSAMFDRFQTRHHITIETYYRFLIADLLENVDQCLYLDVDIVCYGDIAEFLDIRLADTEAMAGVYDWFVAETDDDYIVQHGKNPSDYVNAGVLLLNLDYWRKQEIAEKLLDYCSQHELIYHDQCALNFVLKDSTKLLPEKFNQTASDKVYETYLLRHFNGQHKPWNYLTEDRFYYQLREECWKLMGQERSMALFIPFRINSYT